MALNKIKLTINSRMYTVVSDEPAEYIEMLGEHINEKVRAVVSEGKNIMGERPMVLAALNICDEYYKLIQSKSSINTEELAVLREENKRLRAQNASLGENNKRLEEEKENRDKAEEIARRTKESKELEEAKTQVKFLEGRIKQLEEKSEKMKKEYERREQEIFDMFDNSPKTSRKASQSSAAKPKNAAGNAPKKA